MNYKVLKIQNHVTFVENKTKAPNSIKDLKGSVFFCHLFYDRHIFSFAHVCVLQ